MTNSSMNYSIGRVAEFCDVHRTTVSRWVGEGRLKAFKLPSGHLRVDGKNLIEFLQQYHMPLPVALKHAVKNVFVLTADPDLVDLLRRSASYWPQVEFVFKVHGDPLEAGFELGQNKPDLLVVDLRITELDINEFSRLIGETKALSHMASWVFGGYDKEAGWEAPKLFGKIHKKPWQVEVIKEKFKEIL